MTITPLVNEFRKRAVPALMDAEAARVSNTEREARHMKHRLFAMIRERFGCRHTDLPYGRYKEAASRLIEEPLE